MRMVSAPFITPKLKSRLMSAGFVAGLGFALRLLHLVFVHDALVLEPRGVLDDAFYHQLGTLVASGDLMAGPEIFYLSPLYIYFLGFVYSFLPHGLVGPFFLQILSGTAGIWLVYKCGETAWNQRAGFWAALLVALDGMTSLYQCSLLSASLDPFLFALFLYALIRTQSKGGVSSWCLAGASAALMGLNRPNALVLVPLVPLLAFAADWRPGINARTWKRAAAALVAACALIAPATVRNYIVSGEPVLLTSHGGLNFYIGNRQGATGTYRSPEWLTPDVRGQVEGTRTYLSKALGRPVSTGEVSGILYRRTWEEIKRDPAGWLKLLGTKFLYVLNAKEAGLNNLSLEYIRELFSSVLWLMPVGMGVLVPLGIAGAVAGRNDLKAKMVALLALAYGATVILFFVSARYRLPLHVPLALLGGYAADRFYQAVKLRWRKELLLLPASFVLALSISWLDVGIYSGEAQTRLLHALRLVEEGRINKAESVIEGMPEGAMNPFYWRFKLARAYKAAGAYQQAENEYKTLIKMAPDYGPLRCELAELLVLAGRTDAARAELEKGLELDPSHKRCRQALSRAKRAPGIDASSLPEQGPSE
ncbi:MAG: glycosyltransferase family 39 protein [bacterium]